MAVDGEPKNAFPANELPIGYHPVMTTESCRELANVFAPNATGNIGTEDLGPLSVGTDKDRRLRGESRYGVGGSPFRDPNEKPPENLFTSLSPGDQAQDRTLALSLKPAAQLERNREVLLVWPGEKPRSAKDEQPEPVEGARS